MLRHIFRRRVVFLYQRSPPRQRDAKEDVCRWPEQVSRQRIGALARDSSGSTATTATSLSLNSRRSFTPCGEGGMLPTAASLNSCLQRPLSCECICQMLFSRTFDPKTAWARKALLHWHASKRWSSEALGWFGSRGHFAKVAARSRTTIRPTWSKIAPILNLRREVYRSYDSSFLSVKRFASLSIRA
jgi:hypothetical protein